MIPADLPGQLLNRADGHTERVLGGKAVACHPVARAFAAETLQRRHDSVDVALGWTPEFPNYRVALPSIAGAPGVGEADS